MKKVILFICFPALLISQSNKNGLDSDVDQEKIKQLQDLKVSIHHNGLKEEDVVTLIRIQNLYELMNIDSALVYTDKEIFLTKQIGKQNLLAGARIRKARLLRKVKRYKEARILLLANLEESFVINDSLKGASFRILASVNSRSGQFVEATENVLEAIALFSKHNDSINLSSSYRFLARIYERMGDGEKATAYYQTAENFDNESNKRLTIRLRIDKSNLLMEEGKFKASLVEIQKAEALAESINAVQLKLNVQAQYARLYKVWQDDEKLLQHALKADALLKAHPVSLPGLQRRIYQYLAQGFEAQQNYTQALQYLKLIDGNTYESIEVKPHLIRVYENIGDFELAHFTNKALNHLEDSLNFLAHKVQMKEVLEKYESGKKQWEIEKLNDSVALQKEQLKKQNIITYSSIGFFLLLSVIAIILYKNEKNKSKLREAQSSFENLKLQQRFLRTQLNPHFLFHALSSIESYIYKGKKEQAAVFLQNFSKLMRNTLESSDMDFIPLKEDMAFIKRYIELQRLNHEFKFDYTITVQGDIDASKVLIPPMLTQPFVENAIIHGALHSEGNIDISVTQEANHLIITINDDGQQQFEDSNASSKLNRSMSTDIVMERIQNLKNTQNIEIQYSLTNHSLESDAVTKGTTVTLSIPIIYGNFTKAV